MLRTAARHRTSWAVAAGLLLLSNLAAAARPAGERCCRLGCPSPPCFRQMLPDANTCSLCLPSHQATSGVAGCSRHLPLSHLPPSGWRWRWPQSRRGLLRQRGPHRRLRCLRRSSRRQRLPCQRPCPWVGQLPLRLPPSHWPHLLRRLPGQLCRRRRLGPRLSRCQLLQCLKSRLPQKPHPCLQPLLQQQRRQLRSRPCCRHCPWLCALQRRRLKLLCSRWAQWCAPQHCRRQSRPWWCSHLSDSRRQRRCLHGPLSAPWLPLRLLHPLLSLSRLRKLLPSRWRRPPCPSPSRSARRPRRRRPPHLPLSASMRRPPAAGPASSRRGGASAGSRGWWTAHFAPPRAAGAEPCRQPCFHLFRGPCTFTIRTCKTCKDYWSSPAVA